MSDDERSWNDEDRPSWREIDQKREKPGHHRDEPSEFHGTKKQQAWARGMAKRAAEEVFKPKKSAEQQKAEQKLVKAKGSPAFDDLALAFLEEFGLTDDWHIHLLLSDAKKNAVAIPAIEALAAQADSMGDTEKRNIVAQLKMLAMTGKMKIKKAAKSALEVLD
ncbi:MAG: hypothetical protein P9L99_18265 [Candidatus Lernaella stagnicola]|nr:hypothetical protein [Candidatus Lernaella stagnicola]